jgi:EAL domain-containing protein (putative c-di-GMP-specific phosphodiesterase class I)
MERSLINNIDSASETLRRLRRLGATIVLDNFGTGYSSLAHLRRFRLDKVKIDAEVGFWQTARRSRPNLPPERYSAA